MKRIALVLLLACSGALAQQTQDAAQQAQLAARQAELARMRTIEAQLTKLRETDSGSHPEIMDLSAQLERLRQQEAKIAPAIAAGNWVPYGKPPGPAREMVERSEPRGYGRSFEGPATENGRRLSTIPAETDRPERHA